MTSRVRTPVIIALGILLGWSAGRLVPPQYALACPGCGKESATPTDKQPDAPQDPPTPCVALRLRGPAESTGTEEVEYRITVENISKASAHHVIVRNPIPANAKFVRAKPAPADKEGDIVWQLGTLEAGATKELLLVLQPTEAGNIQNCARVQFEHGQCVETKILKIDLDLKKEGPVEAAVNETLTYQIKVKNTGDIKLTGVKVQDLLPPGLAHESGHNQLTWNLGHLAPGEEQTVDYKVVAKATGRQCNHVTALADGDLKREIEKCVDVSEPKLKINKKGPDRQYLNQPVRYQIAVTNPGTGPARNVVVTDTLPPDTTLVGATEGANVEGETVRWAIGTLDAGMTKMLEVGFRAKQTGVLCNQVKAEASGNLSAKAEACTEFVGVPALLLELVDLDDPVEVGRETSYSILVRNQGTEPATNVVLEAFVPRELQVARANGPSDHSKDGDRILYKAITIPPKSDAKYSIFVKALEVGDIRFKVKLTADMLVAGPVMEDESTTIFK